MSIPTEDHGVLLATGWEFAFKGTGSQFGTHGVRRVAVYDLSLIVARLAGKSTKLCGCQGFGDCEKDHVSDAIDFAEFNILGAYLGDGMPVFLTPRSWDEWQKDMEELS
jgi:hypothetical protein